MKIEFAHNYQKKILVQSFVEPTVLASQRDVLSWRQQWLAELKTWHSPYKALIDCRHLTINDTDNKTAIALERMIKFFKGFFLKKAVGIGAKDQNGHELLPFEMFENEQEAFHAVGLREPLRRSTPDDFRAQIQLENHFRQHAVELSFASPVVIDSKEKLQTLRDKLSNNLMQWHSKWNLIVDCSNFELASSLHSDFERMERFFRGLFLKQIVGYSPRVDKSLYPFEVYRSRHRAVAFLEAEGKFSGDEANCQSRQSS